MAKSSSAQTLPDNALLEAAKNIILSEMRRNGGLKGGPARASSLSPERRKEIARMGGQASSLARRPLPKIDPGVLGKIKDV